MKRFSSGLVVTLLAVFPLAAHAQRNTIGVVHFSTSCAPPVTARFDSAVALLHSFEFGAAIRTFGNVLGADSTCAMANWGIALSRWSNPMAAGNRPVALLTQGRQSVNEAVRLASHATERERGYIDAVGKLYEDFEHTNQLARLVAYEQAMKQLAIRFPADTEAAIFHALSLTASASPTDKTYAKQLEAGAILEKLWVAQPNHPGIAHYIIHSYDYPALAEKARKAAAQYSTIAPSAAHALHMPSHTFTRTGMWSSSAEASEKSKKAAEAAGSIAEALHASDYAMYAYLQMGKESEAKAILDDLPRLEARFDPTAVTGAAPGWAGLFALAAIPARWALERGQWSEAAVLVPRRTTFPYAEAMTHFARALGAAHTGDLAKARESVDSLASVQKILEGKGEQYWAEQTAILDLAARAWLELAEHKNDAALQHMREAVAREDATEKDAVTPGPLAPARELLGDMLVELGRPAEAIPEYRKALAKEPNRRHSLRRLESLNSRNTASAEHGHSPHP